MDARQVKRIAQDLFPGCTVRVRPYAFRWFTRQAERRELPAFIVEVLSKEFHIAGRSGKRVYHHPEQLEIAARFRQAGYCAECQIGTEGPAVIDAPREEWPTSATGLGAWHSRLVGGEDPAPVGAAGERGQ